MIHVCSLSRLPQVVEETGARHVVTLINSDTYVLRPMNVEPENHLWLPIHDIAMPLDGYVHPAEEHVGELLNFVRRWDRAAPLVVHCYAGISRSTASAFVTVCALNPHRSEAMIAQALRDASPTASPNELIVSIADQMLGRNGRMKAAIASIGRGNFAEEAQPFRLDLD